MPANADVAFRTNQDREALFLNNRGLARYAVRRFASIWRGRMELDDVVQLADIAIWLATKTFDPKFGTFSTYAVNGIRLRLSHAAKVSARFGFRNSPADLKLNQTGNVEWHFDSYSSPCAAAELCRDVLDRIAYRPAADILVARYIDGKSIAELSAMLNTSAKNVTQRIAKAKQIVRRAARSNDEFSALLGLRRRD